MQKFLSFRLKKLKEIIKKRKRNINLYRKYIKTDKVKILVDGKNEINSYVMFQHYLKKKKKLKYLKKYRIQSLLYYPTPLHMHKSMKFLKYGKEAPNAEKLLVK